MRPLVALAAVGVQCGDVGRAGPAARPVLDSSKKGASFEGMEAHMKMFETAMQKVQSSGEESMQKLRSSMQAKLIDARQGNAALVEQNSKLLAEIDNLTAANDALLREAGRLKADGTALSVDIRAMQRKWTDAVGKAQATLQFYEKSMASPQLEVLSALSMERAMIGSEISKARWMQYIEGLAPSERKGRRGALPLLQTGQEVGPRGILARLADDSATFKKQQLEKGVKLKAGYASLLGIESRKKAALLKRRARLQQTRQDLIQLGRTIRVAVKHLRHVREELQTQAGAMHKFSYSIGVAPAPLKVGGV